ncbi:unnamed protein product [Ectocarpus fasciculatus]
MTGAATKAAAAAVAAATAATAVPNAPVSDPAAAGDVTAVEEQQTPNGPGGREHRSSSSDGGSGCNGVDLSPEALAASAAHQQKAVVEALQESQQPLEGGAAPGTSPAAVGVNEDAALVPDAGVCDDSVDNSGGGGAAQAGGGGAQTDSGKHSNGVSQTTTHPPPPPLHVPASATATKPLLAEWVKTEGDDDDDDDSDVDTDNSLRGGSGAPSRRSSDLSCPTTPAAAGRRRRRRRRRQRRNHFQRKLEQHRRKLKDQKTWGGKERHRPRWMAKGFPQRRGLTVVVKGG